MPRNASPGSFDECLRALEHERRREVLATLLDSEPLRPSVFAADDRERLSLLHTHLPLLADMGYIDWDREAGCVGRGPRFDEVATLLGLLRTHQDALPWPVV